MISKEDVIEKMQLIPLPEEGGFYRETYRNKSMIPGEIFEEARPGSRNLSTAIFYMITQDEFSALHRLPGDEIFHFYGGSSVEMFIIYPDGKGEVVVLGGDFMKNEQLQFLVPAGSWQGLRISKHGEWALLGTTMAPGFAFEDFEIGPRNTLLEEYPKYSDLIVRYTRG